MTEDKFESLMLAEMAFRKRAILNRIDCLEDVLKTIKNRVENDHYLNDLGELQSEGVMLDAAIVAYAIQRQALKNYQEMRMRE